MSVLREIKWFLNRKKLRNLKLLAVDIDGVLTDGGLFYDSKGNINKIFNVKDGLGLKLLQSNNIQIALISGGKSGASNERAKDLNIKYCLTGIKNKGFALLELQAHLNIPIENTIFVGDDLNDLVLKKNVSLLICPKDSARGLIKQADLTLNNKGGKGAIRELAERILIAKGIWKKYLKSGWRDLN